MNKRLVIGFGWGVVATIAMSIVMIIGTKAGIAPMPKPIPATIVVTLLGIRLPKPLIMLLAVTSHLLYGGVFGAILAALTRPVTVWKGDWKAWKIPEGANPPAKPEGYGVQVEEVLQKLKSDLHLEIKAPSEKRETYLAHVGAKFAREKGQFSPFHNRVFDADRKIWTTPSYIGDHGEIQVHHVKDMPSLEQLRKIL
jgi:hypothetical protein